MKRYARSVYLAPESANEAKMRKLLREYLVRQAPLSPGVVLPETTSVKEAVETMKKSRTGCIVTARGKKITGIFTERDLLYKIMNENVDWNDPVSKFATASPVTMTPNEPIKKALYLMRKKNFRHIPIFGDDEKLLGVLSIRNIVKLSAEHFPKEILNLPPKLNRHAQTPEGG